MLIRNEVREQLEAIAKQLSKQTPEPIVLPILVDNREPRPDVIIAIWRGYRELDIPVDDLAKRFAISKKVVYPMVRGQKFLGC